MTAPGIVITPVTSVTARLLPGGWQWAETNAEPIAENWRRIATGRPGLFDGRVLLCRSASLDGSHLSLGYCEVAYSAFIGCRDMGWPDAGMANCFAMAALRSADGAYLLGEMGAQTANAGKIYFPAGTPDLDDVTAEGEVDLAGSVFRELEEETGLAAAEVDAGTAWTMVRDGPRIALMRETRSPLPAAALKALIVERLAGQADPELSAIHVAFRAGDIARERMPPFMAAFLDYALPG